MITLEEFDGILKDFQKCIEDSPSEIIKEDLIEKMASVKSAYHNLIEQNNNFQEEIIKHKLDQSTRELPNLDDQNEFDPDLSYNLLFSNMFNGFALHKIITDANGTPIDYEFVKVNYSFEKLTGLKAEDIIGKRVTEVMPEIKNDPANWIERYGEVAISGKPINFENYSVDIQRWYNINAYSPLKGHFAVLFEDITQKKLLDLALQESHEEIATMNEELQTQNEELGLLNDRIQKENRLAKHYLKIAGVMFIALDKSGKVILANQKASDVLGYDEKDIVGKNWFDHFLPKDRIGEVKKVFKKLVSGEIEFTEFYENPVINNKNEELIIAWHNSILKDENDEIVGLLSSGEDITERRKAELSLKESEERYRTLVESSPNGIVTVNKLGKVVSVNNTFLKVTGYKEEDFVDKHFLKIPSLLKQDFPFYINIMAKLIKGENLGEIEFKWKHANGEIKDGNAKIGFLKANNKVIGLQAILTDTTESKRFINALRESEERFELAMKASNDGLYDWNLITNEIYYSPGWKKMLGYEDHELPNDFSIWENLTKPEDVKKSWEMLKEIISKKREHFRMEFQMKHKDGHWVDILSRAKAIFDKSGKAIKIIGTHVDISERKKKEIELKESESKFRSFFENAPDGIFIANEKGEYTEVNPSACHITGYNKDELLNLSIKDLIPEEFVEFSINHFNQVKNTGFASGEGGFIYKNNGVRYWSIDAVKISDQKYIGFVKDITDRKISEKELLKYREHLEELVKERTEELAAANEELQMTNTNLINANNDLERFNNLFVGREFRIKELKEKVKELEEKLKRYNIN